MKKLKLDLGDLRVESFGTAADAERAGTVHGMETIVVTCNGPDCPGYTDGCGYTPLCPGYTCTALSTCKYPTAVYDQCPPGWTDDEPACWVPQPQTYYCGGTSGGETGGAMC